MRTFKREKRVLFKSRMVWLLQEEFHHIEK